MQQPVKRHSIRLNSGGFWDFKNVRASQFTLEDIAHNLSKEPRYNGANDGDIAYSVAQHEVNASYIVEPGFEFEALHHDDAEFAYKDVTTWLKALIPDYRNLLRIGEDYLADWYGIKRGFIKAVKQADLQMLVMEKRALFKDHPGTDGGFYFVEGIEVDGLQKLVDLKPWSPRKAKAVWLARHKELVDARNKG